MPSQFAFRLAWAIITRMFSIVLHRKLAARRPAYAPAWPISGKIILTLIRTGRRHDRAARQTRPQGDRAGRGALPEPAPGTGHRRGVQLRRLLRRPRLGAGQVR